MKRKLSLAISAVILIHLFCACGTATPAAIGSPEPYTFTPSTSVPVGIPDGSRNDLSAYYAADYEEVFELFSFQDTDYRSDGIAVDVPAAAVDAAAENSVPEAPAADAPAAEPSAPDDYSQTNVQVEGIDEGDIVKTDGRYIYILHDGELMIYEAAGANTHLRGRITLGAGGTVTEAEGYDYYYEYSEKMPDEMYVSGSTVVVISYDCRSLDRSDGTTWTYEYSDKVTVDFIDVSSPDSPLLTASASQDGNNRASRLYNGKLYLVSTYYVSGGDIEENEPRSYVPCITVDGIETPLAADSIAILPDSSSRRYSVIGVYDVASAALEHAESILGAGDTVYMTAQSLYLADTEYYENAVAERTESIYSVTDYESGDRTNITRYNLSAGGLTLAATGSVPGYLESQFSMDEHNGHLRMVTTVYESNYTIYHDPEQGFTNYIWNEDRNFNGLYILDEDLNIVGSIEGLAENETVYSARFDGDIGYFVTFRQTDPLFAVDLSDPTSPVVLSALKIPGFSEYLHIWSDERLFGLGMDANETTGITNGMKLSMFDTSNPADVREACTLCLDYSSSEALYNHKAILISPDRNIIGFPADNCYLIYGYSDDAGFEKRAEIACGDNWGFNSRGIYIGNFAYIIGSSITVLDLESMTLSAVIALG